MIRICYEDDLKLEYAIKYDKDSRMWDIVDKDAVALYSPVWY